MPQIDMPMHTAHQHAANAEDYLGNGLLMPAMEEHLKAAEAYMASVECSSDESAKRTLKMLYNDHQKAARELERRIAKLREDGKDPSLPQKIDPPRNTSQKKSSGGVPQSPGRGFRPMIDSQGPVDESFMVLNGQRSEAGDDAFKQFWSIMQGMLDNLSQPVAFATAPLGIQEATQSGAATPSPTSRTLRRDGSLSSDTDLEEPMVTKVTRRLGMSARDGKNSPKRTSSPLQTSVQPSTDEDVDDEEFLDEGDDLSESFCLIPSGKGPSPVALKKENAALKTEVEAMKKRLEATERMLQLRKEHDLQLRDSIYLATNEARRAMGASVIQRQGSPLDIGPMNLNIPPIPGYNTAREAQYARRVKELEDEMKALRVELEKTKADNVRHRERWAKVKESARRKKEMKATAEAAHASVREKIVEDPEAEEAEDSAQRSSIA